MKIVLFTFLILLFINPIWAKIITVDNNPGAGANFSTLTDAITAASHEDTIQVHPSQKNYGNITVNKKITFIGPGHYPEGSNTLSATIGNVVLRNSASGAIFTGLRIGTISLQNAEVVNNILLQNNFFYAGVAITSASSDGDNWIVKGNVFFDLVGCGGCQRILLNNNFAGNSVNENWLIANNIIISPSINYLFSKLTGSITLLNNTIISRSNNASYTMFLQSELAEVKNNIIIFTETQLTNPALNCTNCNFTNNLTFHPNTTMVALPGTGNLDNTDPGFVNVPAFTWDYNYDFNVQSGSPAENSGTDGTEPGAYGTNFNFSKFGYPFGVPQVDYFSIDNPQVVQGENLIIRVKATAGKN